MADSSYGVQQLLLLWQSETQHTYSTGGLRRRHPSRRIYSVVRSESLGDEPAMLHKRDSNPERAT